MFLPGESLYGVALEQMPELIEEGFARGVLVATPTTLLGLLRDGQLRLARGAAGRKRPADQRRGPALHERIATVLEHFADLGNALNQSVKHFNRARNSFDARVVVSARRLEELDARGKKELVELEEIEVRAATPERPEPSRAAPPRLPAAAAADAGAALAATGQDT